MPKNLDPTVLLLFIGTFIAAGFAVLVAFLFKDDGVIFQVFATLVGSLSAAMLAIITGKVKPPEPPKP